MSTRPEVTTVADDMVVIHVGGDVHRFDGLTADTEYEFVGTTVRTLARPDGELLCRFATVNDLHFGEIEAGRIDDHPLGPVRRVEPGESPHPEVMNRAAVTEISAIDPVAVFAKGDLSQDGADEEWSAFEACYRSEFGDRLHAVRGNHDSYRGQERYAGDTWVDLPGIRVGLLDTVMTGATTGWLTPDQMAIADDRMAVSDRAVLLMGHHQQWIPRSDATGDRHADYFGLHPDPSDELDRLFARHPRAIGYTAGHTHRHRRRSMRASGASSVEVGCVKDFPGTWAEYRVYDSGVMQIVHRISSPEALAWSETCRNLYEDFGVDYEQYAAGSLNDRCFVF